MPVDDLTTEQRLRERCVILALEAKGLGGSAQLVCESAEALFQYVMSGRATADASLSDRLTEAVRAALEEIEASRRRRSFGED